MQLRGVGLSPASSPGRPASATRRTSAPSAQNPESPAFCAPGGEAAGPAPSRPPWWQTEEICAHVASYFHDPLDAAHFEAALGRSVDGLWGAFGGYRLRRILAAEIDLQRRQQGHRRVPASDAAYDTQMRELCTYGLLPADLNAMADARVRELHRRLASESWRELPLLRQIEREAHWRQDLVFGQLRRQWNTLFDACHVAAREQRSEPTLAELAEGLPELTRRHAHSWRAASAWLGQDPFDARLQRAGRRCLAAMDVAPTDTRPGDSPGAPTPPTARALLTSCLDALDALAQARQLRCPLVPDAFDGRALAADAWSSLQPTAHAPGGGPPWFAWVGAARRRPLWPGTA